MSMPSILRSHIFAVAMLLAVVPITGSFPAVAARPESRGEAVLSDPVLFPAGFLSAWLDYSGRQPYPVPSWHRPRESDVVLRHGAPDVEMQNEIDGRSSRVAVYGNVALGLESEAGEDVVAWITEWHGTVRTDGPSISREECAPSYDGRWNGTSGVGGLSYTIANRALTRVQIQFSVRNGGCSASGSSVLTFSSPLPISGTNLFVSVPPIPDLGFTLRGTLDSSASATGTLQFIFIPCGYDSTSAWMATNRTFGLCVLPASVTIGRGDSAMIPVEVLSIGGFVDAVGLVTAVTPADANVTANLASTTVTPGGATTLTVATTSGAPFGSYVVMVTGTSGGDSRTRSATVTVSPPDFSLAIDPPAIAVSRKEKGTIPVTIGRVAGFSGNVTVNAPDTKAIKVKLTPASLSTTGSGVTFDFKVKKKAAAGVYELVFTGRDAEGRTRTATLVMTVQ